MVRSQTLPWPDYARATSGQFTWVYLNQLIDYEERVRKIHTHCLAKFNRDTCEVCGEAVIDVTKLPPEIQAKVYRPKDDEQYFVEEKFENEGVQKVAIHKDDVEEAERELISDEPNS
jgi:hypothetical protein